jgi:hypothetical protein
MFVKIIDCGESFSTTMEFIDGVYANRTEWEKYNFYPQNGMVGEVVKITPRAYILKVKDKIYVPMTKRGIKEITREEYLANKGKNVCVGMNEHQQRIKNGVSAINADVKKRIDDAENLYIPNPERSANGNHMKADDFINNFPAEFIESVDKNYENLKARIVFSSKINSKYGGNIFQVILTLDKNLYITALGFLGMDLEPLQQYIQKHHEFENQYCGYYVIDNQGFPERLTVICSY